MTGEMKIPQELELEWDRLTLYLHADWDTTGQHWNRLGKKMLAWIKSTGGYLYHGTYDTNLESIQVNGLIPIGQHSNLKRFGGCLPRVYFALTLDKGEYWMPEAYDQNHVLLRVKPDTIDPEKVDADPMAVAIRVNGTVPPEQIEYLDGKEWKPISGFKPRFRSDDLRLAKYGMVPVETKTEN